MDKKIFVLILCFLQILFTSGCWDYKDIDDLYFPIVGGYDISNNTTNINDDIIVSGYYSRITPQNPNSVKFTTTTANTIGDSRNKSTAQSPKSLAFGTLQVIIYGRQTSIYGLKELSNIYIRSAQAKGNTLIAVANDTAEGLLNTKIEQTTTPMHITNLLKYTSKDTFIPYVTFYQFFINSYSIGQNPIVPVLSVIENDSSIAIIGTGIFKKDKLIGQIDLKQTRDLVLLRGIKSQGQIPFTVVKEGGIIDKGTVHVKNTRKVKVYKNQDSYTFIINIKLKGNLIEHYNNSQLTSNKELLSDIQLSVKNDITASCKDFINKMQDNFKVDCIDISRYALAKWRNELLTDIDHENFIENVTIIPQVDVKISNIGIMD